MSRGKCSRGISALRSRADSVQRTFVLLPELKLTRRVYEIKYVLSSVLTAVDVCRGDNASYGRISRHRHRHPREDRKSQVSDVRMYRRVERVGVGVDVGVVECGLYHTIGPGKAYKHLTQFTVLTVTCLLYNDAK